MRTIPVSGLMLFWGCVVGCAGLLRECVWTGVPPMGRWAAADWSCAIRGSCQVVVLSRWLRTHNKSEHICICDVMATWWIGSMRHSRPRTCSTCTTRCACASALWIRPAQLVPPWPLTGERADSPCVLMNETEWNHTSCKTRWNVFCLPATD